MKNLTNKFLVTFPKELPLESFMVKSITKPRIVFCDANYEWGELYMNLLCPVKPSAEQIIYDHIVKYTNDKGGYYPEEFVIKLSIFDIPQSDIIEEWQLFCSLKEVSFGDTLSTTSKKSKPKEIFICFKVNNCILTTC